MMLSRRTLLKLVAAGAVPAFALCGCAHPQMIDLGSTESQVVEKLGKPDSITAMPDGTTRYTYSLQPEGQEVWWMFFDKNGRFVKREQALVEENFYRLIKPGKTTIADVYRLFGTARRFLTSSCSTSPPTCTGSRMRPVRMWCSGFSMGATTW